MCPMRLVLLLILTIGGAEIAGGSSDEGALLAFKAGISDEGTSSALASWNSSTSFCRWEGVSLTNLLLAYNQLGGHIPMELGNKLTQLQKLHLRNNSFTGEIPASLANLSSLQYLHMGYNQLEGLIPAGLGNKPALRYLNFHDNRLSGRFPTSLWNLSALTVLAASRNKLQGSIPANIGDKFPDMQQFALEENMFTGVIPSSLFNLSSLTNLYLSSNRFTGFVPPTVGRLQSLVLLDLYTNQLEANDRKGWEFVASLTNCSQLQQLDISENLFRGQLPSSIANLSTTLQTLYLGNNNITGRIPEDIGNLIGLETLSLGFTSFSGELPTSIGRLANLGEIGLYNTSLSGLIPSSVGNQLSGQIPKSIGNCEVLEILLLDKNSFEGVIPQSFTNLKGLGILNLTMNKLSGRIPDTIEDKTAKVGDFGISRILPKSAIETLQNPNSTASMRGSIGYIAPGSVTSTIEQCLASVIKLSISCSKQQAKERMVLADAVSEMHTIRDVYLRSRMVNIHL
ncbi:hypothetical protein ABZP36_016662 [Zizania latifolia]